MVYLRLLWALEQYEQYQVGVKLNPCTLIENDRPPSQLLPKDLLRSAQSQMENSE